MKNLYIFIICLLAPTIVYAECVNYKIVDKGDTLEAICVGDSNAIAPQKEQSKTINMPVTNNGGVFFPNRSDPPSARIEQHGRENPDDNKIIVNSYDIKYIPYETESYVNTTDSRSNSQPSRYIQPKEIQNTNIPRIIRSTKAGNYSVKLDVTNTGRSRYANFTMKQIDSDGFETESIKFSEHFGKDESKTVTTHLPASSVPAINSGRWIIDVN
jgi:hypothetical protein